MMGKINTRRIARFASVGVLAFGLAAFTVAQVASALTADHIVPSRGPTVGGNVVTIIGSGFKLSTPTMQDFGNEKCVDMTVYDGTNPEALLTLHDPRGAGQDYKIAKLADGKCWMVDNLKLGSTTGALTLTPADSNVARDYELPQLTDDVVYASDRTLPNTPYAYGPVPGDLGTPETNYGYLYKWCVATAGDPALGNASTCTISGTTPPDAAQDICPAGWRLPRGGDWGASANEFDYLSARMAGFVDNQDLVYQSSSTSYYANWQFSGPFRGVYSGQYTSGIGGWTAWASQGTGAGYWTSTHVYESSARSARLNISTVMPSYTDLRFESLSVRCVAQTFTTDRNVYELSVTVDGVAVETSDVTEVSDTELKVRMPAHTAGVVDVAVRAGSEARTLPYEYIDPPVPGVPNTGRG